MPPNSRRCPLDGEPATLREIRAGDQLLLGVYYMHGDHETFVRWEEIDRAEHNYTRAQLQAEANMLELAHVPGETIIDEAIRTAEANKIRRGVVAIRRAEKEVREWHERLRSIRLPSTD